MSGVTIRVVLADDHQLVRAGFRMILGAEDHVEVVGEAPDGEAAVAVVRRLRPDVVLMDVQMPVLDGIEATRRIVADPAVATRVVICTTFERDEYVFRSLAAGASGFVLKNAPPEDLVRAVEAAAAGDALLSPSVTRRLIAEFAGRAPRTDLARAVEQLTERELEVLHLLAAGLSNAEIAARLVVGEATVKTHVSRVLLKLGLRDRVAAVIVAYESGLVRPGDDSGLRGIVHPPQG